MPDEPFSIDLDPNERLLLRCGLVEWGGPARCTEEMAVALGFASVEDLFREGDRLISAIEAGERLTSFDWCRTVLATEIAFASDLMGSGNDWKVTTGLADEESLRLLRQVQRKLPREVYGVIGESLGTRPPRGNG